MILGIVTGQVVSTQKDEGLTGCKLLVVQHAHPPEMTPRENYVVALDTVGAGVGECAIVVTGSSARFAEGLRDRPVDSAIVGIVDTIEIGGRVVYSKTEAMAR
jgi:microcompartment protein CcmK/EutM